MVDMASLAAKNEKTRAVGNMNVNARGDILNSHNEVIQDATQRVNQTYQRSTESRGPARAQRIQRPPEPARGAMSGAYQDNSYLEPDTYMAPDIDNEDDFDADRIAAEKAAAKKK
jgi:hypothetical protein